MRVLAVTSHKGGSGKTTLAAHLAVAASQAGGGPVVLVDLDPQGSLADWWEAREADDLAFADTHVARLASDLERLRQRGFRLAIIDTPPASPMVVQAAVQHADLMVMPFRPSPLDLRAAGLTIGMSEQSGKPLAFVLNGEAEPGDLGARMGQALASFGSVIMPCFRQITGMAQIMAAGDTVMDVAPESPTAQALMDVWDAVCQRMERNFRRTVFGGGGVAAPSLPRPSVPGFGRRSVADTTRETL